MIALLGFLMGVDVVVDQGKDEAPEAGDRAMVNRRPGFCYAFTQVFARQPLIGCLVEPTGCTH